MWNEDQDQRRPDYHNYYPYQNYYDHKGRPKKKKHTGLLVVLVVLALISGAASWAVNVLGLRVDLGQQGLTVALGEKAVEQPAPSSHGFDQVPEEVLQVPAEQPAAQPSHDQEGLGIVDSPMSVENRPAEAENALSLQQIYAKVFPSVASISCVHQNGTSTGTGIVMSADGYVITNFHVIENAQQIYVLVGEDSQYVAELVGGDETTDIAVLKVDAADLIPAEFGDSDVLRVGDAVVAIGDPLGSELRGTMTDGIVSAINRDLNLSGRQMTLIQTNAALNSGNSGGPLINCYGQVQGQALDLRAQFFYHMPSGVVITGILEESDAAQKGLEPDDIIVGFDNRPISSLEDLVAAKNDLVSGNTVTLTIFRGGKYYYVDVVLMDQISPEIY